MNFYHCVFIVFLIAFICVIFDISISMPIRPTTKDDMSDLYDMVVVSDIITNSTTNSSRNYPNFNNSNREI